MSAGNKPVSKIKIFPGEGGRNKIVLLFGKIWSSNTTKHFSWVNGASNFSLYFQIIMTLLQDLH